MRRTELANDEYYHVYNRGTDKRRITLSPVDSNRLVKSLVAFNSQSSIGSLYARSFVNPVDLSSPATKFDDPLVDIVAYCFNPNHFHLLLKQVEDGGISKFMHKFGGGFTRYFNEKYDRTGVLFQGKFKARHIHTDADITRMSAYINLNNRVHRLSSPATKLVRSSWDEYRGDCSGFCNKDIVLAQFNSIQAYIQFAQDTVRKIAKERLVVDKSEYDMLKKEFYERYFD